jgi:hypothetical protein
MSYIVLTIRTYFTWILYLQKLSNDLSNRSLCFFSSQQHRLLFVLNLYTLSGSFPSTIITRHIRTQIYKALFLYWAVPTVIHNAVYYHSTANYNTSSWNQTTFITALTCFNIYSAIILSNTEKTSSWLFSMTVYNFRFFKKKNRFMYNITSYILQFLYATQRVISQSCVKKTYGW